MTEDKSGGNWTVGFCEPSKSRDISDDEFQDSLSEFIFKESSASKDRSRDRMQDALEEGAYSTFEDDSAVPTLTNGTVISRPSDVYWIQSAHGPDLRFDVGHSVLLEYNSGETVCGEITGTTEDDISVVIDPSDRFQFSYAVSSEDFGGVNVVEYYNPITYERQQKALTHIAERHWDSSNKRKWGIATGSYKLLFEAEVFDRTDRFDEELYSNPEQHKAILLALKANDLACVQGPPGTGKTRVIIEIVRRLVADGKSVLVTAESNTAADNLLVGKSKPGQIDSTSLHNFSVHRSNEGSDLRIYRNNVSRSTNAVVKQVYNYESSARKAQVVVSTNNSAWRMQPSESFDYVIMDEAGQAMKTSSFIPWVLGDRLILVGDQKQLPPERQSDLAAADDTRHTSLFEDLYAAGGVYGPCIGVMFIQQYRSHQLIADIYSELFYEGDIETAINPIPSIGPDPIKLIDVGQNSDDPRWKNDLEALTVVAEVDWALDAGIEPEDIGIATPYNDQVGRIRTALREAGVDGWRDMSIRTFTTFQGSEREVMFISFTRSNRTDNVGFLSDNDGPNRLNVGISRGKTHTTFIGDWDTLCADSYFEGLYDLVTAHVDPISYSKEDVQLLARLKLSELPS